jgi:hypothetical protein
MARVSICDGSAGPSPAGPHGEYFAEMDFADPVPRAGKSTGAGTGARLIGTRGPAWQSSVTLSNSDISAPPAVHPTTLALTDGTSRNGGSRVEEQRPASSSVCPARRQRAADQDRLLPRCAGLPDDTSAGHQPDDAAPRAAVVSEERSAGAAPAILGIFVPAPGVARALKTGRAGGLLL